ncbi:uncharacterized protein ccdc178 [Paramormyrops kingsleyae]|uniref:uncharacterized protein ccdc178 n=1 Tax=Paramormyrops kingsleyae TaxID=1676925 RepID=UPI003B979DF5
MLKCPSRQNESPLQDEDDLQKACSSRRRSCALANTPSMCVNKAIQHIRELQRKLENCEQSANHFHKAAQKTVDSKVERYCRFLCRVSRISEFPTAQCVEDFGSCLSESRSTLTVLQNEVGGVLVEVMRLIGRLAADWQEAENALEAEQGRQRSLQMKIDGLSLRKQQHFPAPEDETCTSDISEIRMHVKLKKGETGRSQTETGPDRDAEPATEHEQCFHRRIWTSHQGETKIGSSKRVARLRSSFTVTGSGCCCRLVTTRSRRTKQTQSSPMWLQLTAQPGPQLERLQSWSFTTELEIRGKMSAMKVDRSSQTQRGHVKNSRQNSKRLKLKN